MSDSEIDYKAMLFDVIDDNVRLVELLHEIEACEAAWAALPAWLQDAIRGEIEEAQSYRQSAIDRAEQRGREGAQQGISATLESRVLPASSAGAPMTAERPAAQRATEQRSVYDEDGIVLYQGDCLDVMAAMEPASIDAVVCDPPYGRPSARRDGMTTIRGNKRPRNQRSRATIHKPEFWGCYRKRRYETRALAERTVDQIRREVPTTMNQTRLHAYACETCGGWHIGKRKRPKEET